MMKILLVLGYLFQGEVLHFLGIVFNPEGPIV